jgi:hypothetical protein
MVEEDLIRRFLQVQHDVLLKSESGYPFDLVEIGLQFLAAPEMPIQLYNDEYLRLIIQRLHHICTSTLFTNPDAIDQLPRLFPLFRHLARVVEPCAFSDPILIDLCSLSITAFFLSESSQSLQTASCSLLTAIFKRYQSFRTYIIDEIFVVLAKSHGTPRSLTFSNGTRVYISASARLFLELCQSVCSFPMDLEAVSKDLIWIIIEHFFHDSKASLPISKLFEKFAEDVGQCLTHPFYPIASLFMKSLLECCFPLEIGRAHV